MKLTRIRDNEAEKYTDKASKEIYEIVEKTGITWGSDEALCLILDSAFKAGFDCRDKLSDDALKIAVEKLKLSHRNVTLYDDIENIIAEIRKLIGEK